MAVVVVLPWVPATAITCLVAQHLGRRAIQRTRGVGHAAIEHGLDDRAAAAQGIANHHDVRA